MVTALRSFPIRFVLVAAALIVPIAIIAASQVSDLNRAEATLTTERSGVACLRRGYAVLHAINMLEIASDARKAAAVRAAFAAFAATRCPEVGTFARISGRELTDARLRFEAARAVDAAVNAISDATGLSHDRSDVGTNADDAAGYALVDALPPLAYTGSATDRIDVAEAEASAASRLGILDLDLADLMRSSPWTQSAVREPHRLAQARTQEYFRLLDKWEHRSTADRPNVVIPMLATVLALDRLHTALTGVLDANLRMEFDGVRGRRTLVLATGSGVLTLALGIVWLVARSVVRRHERDMRRLSEVALKEARFQAIFAGSPLAIAITDLNGILRECNPAYLALLNIDPAEAGPRPLFAPCKPADARDVAHLFAQMRELRAAGAHVAVTLSRSDDSPIYCEATATRVRTPGDDAEYCAIVLQDFTERQLREERLHHEATHDALTGIGNRAYLIAQLERRLEQPCEGPRFALLFIDVDDFKTINDTLGHAAGDACLVAIAARLRSCVRAGDVLARYGGDEFALLCGDRTSIDMVDEIATRLRDELAVPIEFGDAVLVVSSSIGVTLDRGGVTDADGVIAFADRAMYVDKNRAASRASTIRRLRCA